MDPLLAVIIAMALVLFVATVYMEWLGWVNLFNFLERRGAAGARVGAASPAELTTPRR